MYTFTSMYTHIHALRFYIHTWHTYIPTRTYIRMHAYRSIILCCMDITHTHSLVHTTRTNYYVHIHGAKVNNSLRSADRVVWKVQGHDVLFLVWMILFMYACMCFLHTLTGQWTLVIEPTYVDDCMCQTYTRWTSHQKPRSYLQHNDLKEQFPTKFLIWPDMHLRQVCGNGLQTGELSRFGVFK
jgi:hypothetical protein